MGGKLSRLAGKVVKVPFVGGVIAKTIDHIAITRADRVGELIDHRREHVPQVWEVHTESERILYDLARQYGHTIAAAVEVIRRDERFDVGMVTKVCRRKLEEFAERDEAMNGAITRLEDPVSKAVLRWILINRQRWQDFCIYLEEEKLDTTEKIVQKSPDILNRFSQREEEALRSLLSNEESSVIAGILNLALEFNRVTRERRQKQRVDVRKAV